jgi:hypothetical protein
MNDGPSLMQEGLVRGYEGPRKRIMMADDIAENRTVAIDMQIQLGFEQRTTHHIDKGYQSKTILILVTQYLERKEVSQDK